jgi:hypothetical protein
LGGGIGMTDIEEQCKCLKLKWSVRLMERNEQSVATEHGQNCIRNFEKSFNDLQVITIQLINQRNENVPNLYIELLDAWRTIGITMI